MRILTTLPKSSIIVPLSTSNFFLLYELKKKNSYTCEFKRHAIKKKSARVAKCDNSREKRQIHSGNRQSLHTALTRAVARKKKRKESKKKRVREREYPAAWNPDIVKRFGSKAFARAPAQAKL